MRNLLLSIIILLFSLQTNLNASEYSIYSPDKKSELKVVISNQITWSLLFQNKLLVKEGKADLIINKKSISKKLKVINIKKRQVNEIIKPIVANKDSEIKDTYNELEINFRAKFSVYFRLYNTGIAYRFKTDLTNEIIVTDELFEIDINDPGITYYPEEISFLSHYERTYKKLHPDSIKKTSFASLPVYHKTKDNISMLITESDLADYPAMFLSGSESSSFKGIFPHYVLEIKPKEGRTDRSEEIVKEADYIAKTYGKRVFPWRILIYGNDADLIESNLVFQLARPLKLDDTNWIKPGKVAWDWWNALNISNVDFKSGINTLTYKHYIDFAAEYGLDYIILDEGWSKTTLNVKEYKQEVDVKELIRYGKEKDVGIILWLLWKPLDKETEEILNLYESWGVKGVKVDFMQRADQYMVNYYEKIAKKAAEHHLIVDFHGAFKPAGLRRAYPNVLTYEGVKGLEHVKWSKDITPEHNLTIPFIRMIAGPMDYTPGAMNNAHIKNFAVRFERPMSIGTRCHQLALYIIYESPLQMLCDNPTSYYKEDECTRFIAKIPVTWDETITLKAEIETILAVARRKETDWYIGIINNSVPKNITIDLTFLEEGNYEAVIMEDGLNSEKVATDFKSKKIAIKNTDILRIQLSTGGGWCAIIKRK